MTLAERSAPGLAAADAVIAAAHALVTCEPGETRARFRALEVALDNYNAATDKFLKDNPAT